MYIHELHHKARRRGKPSCDQLGILYNFAMSTTQSSKNRRYKIVLAGHYDVGKRDIFQHLQSGGREQPPTAEKSLRNREKWLAKIRVTGPRGVEETVDVSTDRQGARLLYAMKHSLVNQTYYDNDREEYVWFTRLHETMELVLSDLWYIDINLCVLV